MNHYDDHTVGYVFGKMAERFGQEQYEEYGDSWKKRGSELAFANLNRKMDRLDRLLKSYNYDLFEALVNATVFDCYLDTVVYLRYHMGDYFPLGEIAGFNRRTEERYGPAWQLMDGIGASADILRKVDSLQLFAKSVKFNLLGNATVPTARQRMSDLMGYMILAAGRFLGNHISDTNQVSLDILDEDTRTMIDAALKDFLSDVTISASVISTGTVTNSNSSPPPPG